MKRKWNVLTRHTGNGRRGCITRARGSSWRLLGDFTKRSKIDTSGERFIYNNKSQLVATILGKTWLNRLLTTIWSGTYICEFIGRINFIARARL
jgi:hypothetical protein